MMKLQLVRRLVQVLAVVLVASFAMLSLYAHYRAARVLDDPQLMAGLRGEAAVRVMHPLVERLDDPQGFLDGQKGTLWSMRFWGVDITDPLAAVEMLAASKHVHWPLMLSTVIPVVLALLMGKVFCSWICPGYLLFEITGKLRRVLRIAEIRPGDVTFSHNNKYLFLLAGLCVTVFVSRPLFANIYPPAVISRVLHAWIFDTALTGMVVLLLAIITVELFVSPRWWCRTMCPGGALYGLLGWARPVRVTLRRDACNHCMDCLEVCEAGINPITQSASIECDNCGVCLRHCGENALKYSISLPVMHAIRQAGQRSSTIKTAVLGAIIVSSVITTPASAHHILGLPHYSYKENYPQRPTLEYPATTGPYDILLTSYPGLPNPGEPANLACYVKNRESNRVYTEPVSVRVLQTSTFGDNTVILPPTTRNSFDNQYKLQVTFPEEGEYIVELSMPVEGRTEVIGFLMVVGEPSATASFVVTGALGAVLIFVVIRAVHKKRKRRARARRGGAMPAVPRTTKGGCGAVTRS